ncbi:MAG: Rieske 2Fe-2S domain-containing protein [Alphaproteobacteria bacterium]|nr:Rieske 2Fe-2S domain-containing protein [Alphaproteobacteria bacterium]
MLTADQMLDPVHFANVLKPPLEAENLPPWCYTDAAFHRLEIERIFMKSWNLVGRADLVANPGDYLATDVAGIPVIVLRGMDGAVRAFANSCRHRGTQLLTGEGNCRAIVCPYHSWAFDLDGRLVSAAGMEQTIGFDKENNGLIEIRLDSWADFLFVAFSPDTGSLPAFLGTLPDHLAAYDFSNQVTTRRKVWDVACNWKIYLENQRESYHIPTVHRESLGDQIAAPLESEGAWSGSLIGVAQTAGILKDETTPFPPIASLTEVERKGSHFIGLYPNIYLVATTDCFWWMEIRPRGPDRIELVVGSGFPKETVARDDFDAVVERYYRRWDMSHDEDNRICEQQQAGLTSPLARSGRLARREWGVNAVDRWVVEMLLAG